MPRLREVAEGIWLLRSPMPSTNPHEIVTYLVEDGAGELHIVDPGWPSDAAWEVLESALGTLGRSIADVASVTATHIHIDHVGLAARVQNASGAPIRIGAADIAVARATCSIGEIDSALEGWVVPEARRAELRPYFQGHPDLHVPEATEPLEDGAVLPIPGRTIRARATPGHTPGHLVLVVEDARLVLLGDHLLPESFPGIGLGGLDDPDPVGNYFHSLAAVMPLDDLLACPGHEGPFEGIAARAVETAQHHLRRTREIAQILATEPELSTWEVARRVTWSHGFDGLSGLRLRSALAQVRMHAEFATTELGRRALADGFAAFTAL